MMRILESFKGQPTIYRMHEGLKLPQGLILWHEHTDHYSLQTSEPISLPKFNEKLSDFLRELPSQTKAQFLAQMNDEDDQDN
jgi:hypothetical protein